MDEIRRKHWQVATAGAVSRRAVAQGAIGSGIIAALLATTRREALAQATPAGAGGPAADTGPRRYVLTGGETEIVFTPAAAGGVARLDYRDATASHSFTGAELDVERHESLGQLVSVYLDAMPDAFARYLSLLVPDVNRDEERPDVPIDTLAILTSHLTSIGGPALVTGALQTYEVIALDGVAEFAPA